MSGVRSKQNVGGSEIVAESAATLATKFELVEVAESLCPLRIETKGGFRKGVQPAQTCRNLAKQTADFDQRWCRCVDIDVQPLPRAAVPRTIQDLRAGVRRASDRVRESPNQLTDGSAIPQCASAVVWSR